MFVPPLLDGVQHTVRFNHTTRLGSFGTVPFSLPLVPGCLYGVCAIFRTFYPGIPFNIIYIILSKILYQGTIIYLFITSKCEKEASRIINFISETATLRPRSPVRYRESEPTGGLSSSSLDLLTRLRVLGLTPHPATYQHHTVSSI